MKPFVVLFCLWCLTPAYAAELRLHYDTGWGNHLAVRGDGAGLTWQAGVAADWTPGNVWVLHTPPEAGGFQFKPLLNDAYWSVGANYVVPSGDAVVDVYPFFGPAQGSLDVVPDFPSQHLGNLRTLRVYLPPSYFENTLKTYPVVYVHDGQNLFDPATAAFGTAWELDDTADRLVGEGLMAEAVFVGIDNTGATRIDEYTMTEDPTYGGGRGAAYLAFLVEELMPWVNARYRVRTGPEETVLMGSSLGGLFSFCAAWERPDVFGAAACLSSSFWWDAEAAVDGVAAFTGPLPAVRFYLDIGGLEGSVASSRRMHAALQALGYVDGDNLWYVEDPAGAHNEAAWRDRVHLPLTRLLPPR